MNFGVIRKAIICTNKEGEIMYTLGLFIGAFVPFLIGGVVLYFIFRIFKIKNAFLITIFTLLIIAILMLVGGIYGASIQN